jgi:hypothetical protein
MNTDDVNTAIPDDDEEIVINDTSSDEGSGGQNDDPVAALKGELEKAKRERDEASARFQASEAQRARFEDDARRRVDSEVESQKALIEHAIIAEQSRAELAENAYAEAMSTGNYAEAAKLQRAMAQSEAKISQMQTGLDQITHNIESRKSQSTQQNAVNSIDSYISQFTSPSQEWLRKNKEDIFSSDARGNMAYAGHILAVNSGIKADSEEYFTFLDKHMGYSTDASSEQAQKKKAGHSAPPSRNSVLNGSSTKIAVTAEEKSLASDLGMTVQEYARYKAKIAAGETNLHFSSEGTR